MRGFLVVADGPVNVAGQAGIVADYSIPDDIRAQTRNAFTNLKNVLEAASSSLAHVTHLTQYFTDIKDVPASDEVFAEFFPKAYPACTVLGSRACASAAQAPFPSTRARVTLRQEEVAPSMAMCGVALRAMVCTKPRERI
jgi:enamine deaminase RidA (YjgF/YER057c/UK114 family)